MDHRKYLVTITAGPVLLFCVASTASGAEISEQVQNNIDMLMQENSCRGCNLEEADLNRMDLSGADLSGAKLNGASFFLSDLSDANLSGADLQNAQFGGADLANADLSNADLRGAVLGGAYLQGSNMEGARIEEKADPEAVKIPADVKGAEQPAAEDMIADQEKETREMVPVIAEPEKTKVQAAPPVKNAQPIGQISIEEGQKKNDEELKDHKKIPTSESKSGPETTQEKPEKLQQGVNTTDTVAAQAEFPSDQRAEPEPDMSAAPHESAAPEEHESAEIIEEKTIAAVSASAAAAAALVMSEEIAVRVENLLDRKRCFGCNLQGADLSGKNLKKADLERSDLSGSNCGETDFRQANLKGVSFKGAFLKDADFRNADLYKADFNGADLTGADFRDAYTDEADFTGAIGYQSPLVAQ